MFTGIISDIGVIVNIDSRGDRVLDVRTKLSNSRVKVGDSVSCSGTVSYTHLTLPTNREV